MREFVYVFINEAMPDLVKIGITNDLDTRLNGLYTTGVPLPFKCHYAVAIDDGTAAEVEKKLHTLFAENRINNRREFFRVSPERVVIALSLGNFEEATRLLSDLEQVGGTIEHTDVEAVTREETRRERLKLSRIGIPAGSTLLFTRDNSITCTTLDSDKVLYNGQEKSLSAAALEILKAGYDYRSNSANGSVYWMYDGKTLDERRQHLEQED